jgi:hypothetical protein
MSYISEDSDGIGSAIEGLRGPRWLELAKEMRIRTTEER